MGVHLNPTQENAPLTSQRTTLLPPCVVFEDDHLLVVDKPPGWNTHAPSPYAGEGIHEWLQHREPRWADLAILHRLDKDTSGLLVFGKSPQANRSLARQFEEHLVGKVYRFRTDRQVGTQRCVETSAVVRNGDHHVARPWAVGMDAAETAFEVVRRTPGFNELEARPKTGRTHQIRVHAAHRGWPLIGDALYGGTAHPRLHLASVRLEFVHPTLGTPMVFEAPDRFDVPPATLLRAAVVHPAETDAFRRLHGAADASAGGGIHCDQLGPYVLLQSEGEPAGVPAEVVPGSDGLYFKQWNRHVRTTAAEAAGPRHLRGPEAPERFEIRENGVRYELSFAEGYSVGLFLDQRDNRRRLLVNHVASGFPLFPEGAAGREVLNCFAYTGGFSVCAALAGARATSLDLSRKYLDWARRNFERNGLDPAAHDFIYGDVFDWIRRLGKKGRRFDAVLLDPPTFSRSKEHGDFRAERDYGQLVSSALAVLKPGGVLFASTNAARLEPERFLSDIRTAITAAGRRIISQHYVPQPPDFPISREEPAYLKTVWLRVS